MFRSEQMWSVCTASCCDIEWEEVCSGMSVLKKIEQQLNVKFLVKHAKSEAETNEMLSTVYSEDALKPATVYKCEALPGKVWKSH